MVCLAGAGNVEGSAVIDRAAVDGQAKRDVDRRVEGHQLDRDMPLIVILSDDQIEATLTTARRCA